MRAALCMMLGAALWAQGGGGSITPQRDTSAPPAAVPTGTSEISGSVVTDDPAPRPVRHALVSVTSDAGVNRGVMTDDAGRFVVANLPAGRFTVTARKAAYLPGVYGARRPGRPGTAIPLAAAARTSVSIVMSRGAVLSGTVRDATGQAIPDVFVAALELSNAELLDSLLSSAEFIRTDDRGGYRIFGLMPGEYSVVVTPSAVGTGEIGAPSVADMDAVFQRLAQRGGPASMPFGGSPSTPATPAGPRAPATPAVAFAPNYFPGTALFRDAGRVRIGAGEERNDLDIRVTPVKVASVSGTVSGEVANMAGVQLSVIIAGQHNPQQMGAAPILSRRPDATGRFLFTNMAPGQYRITARALRGATDAVPVANGGRISGAGQAAVPSDSGSTNEFLYAVADLEINGENVDGVALPLQPGSTLSGRIHLDAAAGAAPSVDFTKLRLTLSPPGGTYYSMMGDTIIGNTFSAVPPVLATADARFRFTAIGPGTFVLGATLPAELTQGKWWLRSAVSGGRDLLDAKVTIDPGVNFDDVELTLSNQHTELSGSLRGADNAPAPDYFVIVFPADRALWTSTRRLQSARPGVDGLFTLRDLPGGDYRLAAVTDLDPNEWQRPAMLEQLAAASVPVRLVEGQPLRQDLKIK